MRWTMALLVALPRSITRFKRSPLTLVIALAVLLTPALAWAAPPSAAGAVPTRPVPTATSTSATSEGALATRDQSYESREARAKGLEKFEGGDTTVIIGGSALLVILIVILILVVI
jgi:hypothetical protein